MELYIVFFMIIAVALIVLAIYITKVEHLAVTNRTRIARLESQFSKLDEYNMSNMTTRKISELPIYPILGTVEYELQKAIEENKSLSFQLAEVSKALQEKKLLIYEMDEKLSKLDAKALKLAKFNDESFNLLLSVNKLYKQLLSEKPVNLNTASIYVFGQVEDFLNGLTKTKSEAPKYGKSPIYEALKSIDDSNNNRRWMGVDFGNEPDQSATAFIQEGEELKGFNIQPVTWDMPVNKPLIDAEFVTQGYGESERVEAPQAEELQDHSGSDPIFEADAAEADTAANLEFERKEVKDGDYIQWFDESNEVDPEKLNEVISSRRGTWGSKDGGMQNIPRTKKTDSVLWWQQLSEVVREELRVKYGNNPHDWLTDNEILKIYISEHADLKDAPSESK